MRHGGLLSLGTKAGEETERVPILVDCGTELFWLWNSSFYSSFLIFGATQGMIYVKPVD